jgi:uncharacterized protein YndB with AHSA1/START domain
MTDVIQTTTPVQKSVTVRTGAEHAFRVFTEGFDTWWPKSHHIGSSPMKRAVIEGRVGGRCYGEHEDGTDCPWGTVLVWEPPRRFVFAWQITPDWKYQPHLAQASEVEVRFTAVGDGSTRVDLEHRHFERHGDGAEKMKMGVDSAQGWGSLLQLFAQAAAQAS